ncbi:MAG: hypothetical protein MHM6MM_001770 [Cercozoa sp. M6MM]
MFRYLRSIPSKTGEQRKQLTIETADIQHITDETLVPQKRPWDFEPCGIPTQQQLDEMLERDWEQMQVTSLNYSVPLSL